MLTLILLSFLVTGAIAIYDHYEQKEKYNEQRLRRKEESVRSSMNYFRDQMGDFIQPEVMNMVFSDKICELSDVHNLFIAVFDLNGNYLVSSSSFVMDSLQIPYQVEYEAMKGLTEKNPLRYRSRNKQRRLYTRILVFLRRKGKTHCHYQCGLR